MRLFRERDRLPIALGERLGHGGEAEVFRCANLAGQVAKIYQLRPPADTVRKLSYMLAYPPDEPSGVPKHRSFAWPQDLVVDERGAVAGFLMPQAGGRDLLSVFNPRRRQQLGVSWDWRQAHAVAYNLAATMGALHERQYVIGDVNESNVLVAARSLVTLIDTDSFQVTRDGVVYRCRVGKPEYTPPELQGRDFKDVDRDAAHDRFGLAVLIFQLLMDGNHPFRCRWLGSEPNPPTLEDRIRLGLFPPDRTHRKLLEPAPGVPSLDLLHPQLIALFNSCFVAGYVQGPQARPTARQWVDALAVARQDLALCKSCGGYYARAARTKGCPRCGRPMPALVAAVLRQTRRSSGAARAPARPAPRPASVAAANSAGAQVAASLAPTKPKPRLVDLPVLRWSLTGVLVLTLLVGTIRSQGIDLNLPDPVAALVPSLAGETERIVLQCELSPIVTSNGRTLDWLVRFAVENVDVEPAAIQLNVRIDRTGDAPFEWFPDPPGSPIWLQADGARAGLLDAGGIFARSVTMTQGESYSGWLRFERPAGPAPTAFELVHPNVEPRAIIDLATQSCATVP